MPHLHTGFSLREGTGDGVETWSPELIASLDWLRLGELLRAISVHAGYELGPSRVNLDGSVQFAMQHETPTTNLKRQLVKLTAWNQWGASPETLQQFVNELGRIREPCQGILVAPDGFSPAAKAHARQLGIEAVDAAQIFATLCAMPPEQADFFHTITTAGNSKSPTCPVCLHKLSRVDQPTTRALRSLPGEMIFQSTTVVPDPVACGRLEIMPDCEVTFLHEIRTQELIVRGHVSGDFICQGSVTLEPGSTLTGSVAARSINVRDGAELRGQFRIVEGVSEAIAPISTAWFWRCLNDSAKDACRSVVFQPHG
jgi:hypothetical protein